MLKFKEKKPEQTVNENMHPNEDFNLSFASTQFTRDDDGRF